jgi:hypothetical protein
VVLVVSLARHHADSPRIARTGEEGSRAPGESRAAPLLTFAAVMGIAILTASRVLVARGLPGPGPMELVMV